MKLRTQLAMVAAVVVILPLAGWQFIRQSEPLLRHGQVQSLTDTANTLAALIDRARETDWPPAGNGLYVHAVDQPFILDGYADEWTDRPGREFAGDGPGRGLSVTTARNARGLHLLFEVRDPELVFATPGPDGHRLGDHLRLGFHDVRGRHEVLISAQGPGPVEADSGAGLKVRGVWQPRAGGWNLELRVTAQRPPFGMDLVWVDTGPGESVGTAVAAGHDRGAGLVLIETRKELAERLAGLIPPDTRAWIVDRRGLVLAAADRAEEPSADDKPVTWLDRLIYERLLAGAVEASPGPRVASGRLRGPEVEAALAGRMTSRWRGLADRPGVVLAAAVPLGHADEVPAALIIERRADETLRATNSALLALLGLGFGAAAVVTLVLLLYAAILAERIRRLRDAAEGSVGADGRVQKIPPSPRARDEIGDLGRSVGRLLTRLRSHQEYLRTLADKLTHELRTPLAGIRTSLDNLAHAETDEDKHLYLDRAEAASARLGRILRAMGQASRLEESLVTDAPEPVDLSALLEQYVTTRQGMHPDRRIRFDVRERPVPLAGSPDLIWQMLDKLMDNAVAFTPEGGRIEVRLGRDGPHAVVAVRNQGSPLPDELGEAVFESMVSRRPRDDGEAHLGLGLYVARLIVEHHAGDIRARNVTGGVEFKVRLAGIARGDPAHRVR